MSAHRGRRYAMHVCPMHGCKTMVPMRHVACSDHWALVPAWLRQKITEQLQYGIAWKCHPTQEYLDLRSLAVQTANRAAREKHSPRPTQPSLFA